ncbi:MAG: DUF881 domain-containing protein [Actinomycetota bacterium]
MSRWRIVVPMIFGLAGLSAMISVHTANGTDLRSEGKIWLADAVREQQQRVESQAESVSIARHRVQKLVLQETPIDARLAQMNSRMKEAAALAGVDPLTGSAVSVELNDAPLGSLAAGDVTADDLVVHQQDVQAVVNALWRGGATGMTIMGQRIITTSAVRCVGNVLVLHGRVYSPPYRITAVGDPESIKNVLEADDAVAVYRGYVAAYGLGYRVRTVDRVTLPRYDGPLRLDHAFATRGAP